MHRVKKKIVQFTQQNTNEYNAESFTDEKINGKGVLSKLLCHQREVG